MIRQFFILIPFLFLTLQASAALKISEMPNSLSFKKLGLVGHLHWVKGPYEVQESILQMQVVREADQSQVDLEWSPEMYLWMPDMQHGSSPAAVQRVLDANGEVVSGLYEFSNMYFLMAGQWQVRITLKLSEDLSEMQTLTVPVAGTVFQ